MLPNSPNSLCSLTHTTHTEHSAPHAENPDGKSDDDEAVPLGGDAVSESNCRLSEEFNFAEFFTLATRVLDGDATSMATLISLKNRWEESFKKQRNPQEDVHVPNPTIIKSVAGRTGTPFRPRVSLLPRRNVLSGGPSTLELTLSSDSVQDKLSEQPDIYIGTVKLKSDSVDNIAVRPTREVVENGSKKWYATAVGYFMGKRPYFPQLESFVRSNWNGLQYVSATSSGFYFFQFRSRVAMEEVIEGGPWLFQGQPIVLQFWEQGMTLRRQKHNQIPVWIRLKHLPMEYWTDEGLSTVASGVGTPLYTDGITKECSGLDYARVCVMLDYNSTLPKHLVVISPVLRNGREDPKRVDVEYEWLPNGASNVAHWDI
ncbi:UNVERIFIED_CONTAM: hypothetical protein Sangu_2977300 [Sesamum angustifolium]|uniref:DUF4283 domain-containing protein n=1 Tax=Sesamum angustifolium TaxID=2727405 RepID=A0AAW2IJ39_9LAMI